MNVVTISSPHAHDQSSINRVMLHVCLALIPTTAYGLYNFGYPALILFAVTVASAVIWESLCLKLMGKPQSMLLDFSAVLTGWLIALTLPPWAPWWIAVGGSFIAIVIGKQVYGGIGQNVFNPAMLARVSLLISFPVHMTTWPMAGSSMEFMDSLAIIFGGSAIPDGITGATTLGILKTQLSLEATANTVLSEHFSPMAALLGNIAGSMGETSSLLILLGGGWLLVMRVISWHIPVSMLVTAAIAATVFNWINPELYGGPSFHLLSGGMMIGAFFIATDLVTSPSSKGGQLVFGVGCGALDFIIRTWSDFPEGIGFAVLFMNAVTPLIDLYFRPRIYGRKYDGTPRTYTPTDNAAEDQA